MIALSEINWGIADAAEPDEAFLDKFIEFDTHNSQIYHLGGEKTSLDELIF
jgi:hypothetical protein